MARTVSRGEIWTYRFKAPDKRRLVLVLTRQEVIGLLHTVIVAPIKSTITAHRARSSWEPEEGLKHSSAVNLDHVQTWSVRVSSRTSARFRRRR